MTTPLRIVVPLQPEGKRRHRTRVVIQKHTDPWVQEYPDPAQKDHIEKLSEFLSKAWRRKPSENPFRLGVVAFMPMPQSRPQWWKALARKGEIQPTTKPDISNIVKLVEDVGNGIIWVDDSQIVGYLPTARFYSDAPKYVLTIQELPSAEQLRDRSAGFQVSILDDNGKPQRILPVTLINGPRV